MRAIDQTHTHRDETGYVMIIESFLSLHRFIVKSIVHTSISIRQSQSHQISLSSPEIIECEHTPRGKSMVTFSYANEALLFQVRLPIFLLFNLSLFSTFRVKWKGGVRTYTIANVDDTLDRCALM